MSFPSDFLWGVASSSYQVEGAANSDARTPSIWDTFSHTPGNVFSNQTGDAACDSYNRPADDADLVANLSAHAYRFSVAWSRVIPDGDGSIHSGGLDYYERLCDELLERGVKPWVTLYHWDLPQSLQDRGGWQNREIIGWFARFTEAVAERLAGKAEAFFTLNEPQIFLGMGLSSGDHAPGFKLPRKDVLQATHHALLAHGEAVRVLRDKAPTARIGWCPVAPCTVPMTESAQDIEAARQLTMGVGTIDPWWYSNTWYGDPACLGHYPEDGLRAFGDDAPTVEPGDMERIHQPIDFYGFNLYSGGRGRMGENGEPVQIPDDDGTPITMFRWPVRPEALRWATKFLGERYKLPMYVCENGLASMDWVHADGKVHDPARIDFLARYLSELGKAVAEGVDVRGYFQWSIMDNFEWAEGYRLRFGLTYVDFPTGERIPKDSYHWYKAVIENNGGNLPGPDDIAPLR